MLVSQCAPTGEHTTALKATCPSTSSDYRRPSYTDPFGLAPLDSIAKNLQEKLGNICVSVDCNAAEIVTSGMAHSALMRVSGGRAVTLGNTIYLSSAPDANNRQDVALVAHELTHVFQYQTLTASMGVGRGAGTYLLAGAIDQSRYFLGLGNPYTGRGLLEPMAQKVQNCFAAGSCSGSIFTPGR